MNRRWFGRCLARGLLLSVPIVVAGCGFKLRDAYGIPPQMQRTYIEGGNERSEVYVGLRRALTASGVTLVDSADAASAVLRLSDERSGRRVLSIGRDARVSEYEVFYSLSFDVRARGESADEVLIEPQSLRLTREYVYDATGLLGKTDEEGLLRQEMQRDLVRLIMYRLEAAGS